MRRVVITGMGAVTSLGHNLPSLWASLLASRSGITRADPQLFHLDSGTHFNVALVQNFPFGSYKAPHADNRMNSFLLAAAQQALKDSGAQAGGQRTGLSLGVMSSNTTSTVRLVQQSVKGKYQRISRLSMLQILSNIPASALSIKYGIKGPVNTISTACASSSSAILDAYRRIQAGEADIVLAGGTQDVANPMVFHSSLRLQAMSAKKYDRPQQSSRPFDQQRSGFILGQGAGVIVLQEQSHAISRGVKILGRIIGGATNCDGFHMTRPADKGQGILRAMKTALNQAKVSPGDVDLFNCHATSTPAGDQLQAQAIQSIVGSGSNSVALSLKGHLGHAFGAAGVIQLIAGVRMAQQSTVIGTKNLVNPVKCGVQLLREGSHPRSVKCWVKNSMGFGGVNVCLVLLRD